MSGQSCMVWMCETEDKQWGSGELRPSCYSGCPRDVEWMHLTKVTMGSSSRTRSWLTELVYSPGNSQSLKGPLLLWCFSELALLFKRWWNIIKEHVHYWCLSSKFLLTSASFHPYNARFNDSLASRCGSSMHASFAIWTICFTQKRDNRQCSLSTEGINFFIFMHIC